MSTSEKKPQALLDQLVAEGDLKSYQYSKEYEKAGVDMRTTEKVVLVFPSGNELTLDTFCSGSAENTVLGFSGITGPLKG